MSFKWIVGKIYYIVELYHVVLSNSSRKKYIFIKNKRNFSQGTKDLSTKDKSKLVFEYLTN